MTCVLQFESINYDQLVLEPEVYVANRSIPSKDIFAVIHKTGFLLMS